MNLFPILSVYLHKQAAACEQEASKRGITQKILLRLTPGIDPHTYEAISTGKVDSKFGFAIETGQAEKITEFTLKQPHIRLCGFHCHVGSQVFYENVFEDTSVIMLEFISGMKSKSEGKQRQTHGKPPCCLPDFSGHPFSLSELQNTGGYSSKIQG